MLELLPVVERAEWVPIRDAGGEAKKALLARYRQFAGEGAASAVLDALRGHASDARVQRLGLQTVAVVSRDSDVTKEIGDAGGVEAVVAALRGHASDARVQECGCFALKNIHSKKGFRTEGAAHQREMRARMRDAGAAPLVRLALGAFPSDAGVQRQGKDLLGKLR